MTQTMDIINIGVLWKHTITIQQSSFKLQKFYVQS